MSGPAPSRTRGGWADSPERSRRLGPQALFVEPPPTAVAQPPAVTRLANPITANRSVRYGVGVRKRCPRRAAPAAGSLSGSKKKLPWRRSRPPLVLVLMVCGQTLRVCSPEAVAFCGLVLVFGSKLVSCDAAGLPPGMVSEPRRRLEPTLAGSLVVSGCENVCFGFRQSFSSLDPGHPTVVLPLPLRPTAVTPLVAHRLAGRRCVVPRCVRAWPGGCLAL